MSDFSDFLGIYYMRGAAFKLAFALYFHNVKIVLITILENSFESVVLDTLAT